MNNQHKISTKGINIRCQHSITQNCIHHEISISIHPITMIIQLRQYLVLSQRARTWSATASNSRWSPSATPALRHSPKLGALGEWLVERSWRFPDGNFHGNFSMGFMGISRDFMGFYGILLGFYGISMGFDRDSQDFNGIHGID